MINVPLDYLPMELVVEERLSSLLRAMLRRCRAALARQQWALAERYAANAKEAAQGGSDWPVGYALSLIHLADVYRSSLRLGRALEYNEEAQLTLDKQPGPKYYHNRAVANYALGLTHHALGNDTKAAEWYDRASDLFRRAARHWAWENAPDRQEQCEQALRWIESLNRSLEEWVDVLQEEPLCASIWIPIFQRNTGGEMEPRLFCLPATLRRRGGTLRIGGRTYHVLPPTVDPHEMEEERDLMIDFRVPYFAIEIGPDGAPDWLKELPIGWEEEEQKMWEKAVPRPGDVILVRGRCLGERGALEGVEVSGADFQGGRFIREEHGFRFIVERERIIGGRSEVERNALGQVVALLRPTSHPEEG
ncbi:MAG TPA: hypothetical protein ENK08_04125 [Chloroflexi bacterium]|nr:hypothetical protein [Chloroflexota bacterium]